MLKGESDTWPCPDWYPIRVVAKDYHVLPDDVMERMSLYWKERTLIALTAESQAQEILSKHQS